MIRNGVLRRLLLTCCERTPLPCSQTTIETRMSFAPNLIEPPSRLDDEGSPSTASGVTVVVPTYKRAESLRRCLAALEAQSQRPDHTVVVVRRGDDETLAVLEEARSLDVVVQNVEVPGQVQALNAGLRAVTTPIVAFTDDDAMPRPDWVERIAAWFASDPRIGGVGGRDIVFHRGRFDDGAVARVGAILPFGRMLGYHQYRAPAQEVHFLKGANMAFRRVALTGFNERLRGAGAQIHNDLDLSLSVTGKGYRLVWDPEVTVDHHPADRFDADVRNRPEPQAVVDRGHNEVYVLLTRASPRLGLVAVLYALAVGSKSSPGLLLTVEALMRRDRDALARGRLSVRGRLQGARSAVSDRRRGLV
jgi:GT2 family glycosyltransferase